jgi:hypothetical protein
MRFLFTTACLLFVSFLYAQNIDIKSSFQDKGAKNLSFKTSNIKGSMRATNEKLQVTLKNLSSDTLVINGTNCFLIDKSGRGTQLCCGDLTLESGNSATLLFENCSARNYNEGLFGLKNFYSTKIQFKEDSFFLKNKEFILNISGERILFYTD